MQGVIAQEVQGALSSRLACVMGLLSRAQIKFEAAKRQGREYGKPAGEFYSGADVLMVLEQMLVQVRCPSVCPLRQSLGGCCALE